MQTTSSPFAESNCCHFTLCSCEDVFTWIIYCKTAITHSWVCGGMNIWERLHSVLLNIYADLELHACRIHTQTLCGPCLISGSGYSWRWHCCLAPSDTCNSINRLPCLYVYIAPKKMSRDEIKTDNKMFFKNVFTKYSPTISQITVAMCNCNTQCGGAGRCYCTS